MANLILRPNNVGRYNDWTVRVPFVNIWEDINDVDPDGDSSYVGTVTAGAFTCVLTDTVARGAPLPTRIPGISVIATVRTELPLVTRFKFRIRYLGVDYDSDEYEIISTVYAEHFKEYVLNPNGHAWTARSLNDLEVGLVYVSGSTLRCTKMEVQVQEEAFPSIAIGPNIVGAYQQWHEEPTGSAPETVVGGFFDGDRSYIHSNTSWQDEISGLVGTLRSIWGFAPSDLFVVGDAGQIQRWSGTQWVQNTSGTAEDLYAVWGDTSNDVFAVGTNGTILHFNGALWSPMVSGVTDDLYGVWGFSPTDVFAVGANGVCLRYDGFNWNPLVTGVVSTLLDVWGADPNNVFAVGVGGTTIYFNGAVWAIQASGTPADLYGVWGDTAVDVYAVGDGGTIIHWNGVLWLSSPSPVTDGLKAVWGSGTADIIAVGESGALIRWDGLNWMEMVSEVQTDYYDTWGDLSNKPVVVGEFGEVVSYQEAYWNPISTFGLSDLLSLPFPVVEKVKVLGVIRNPHPDLPAGVQVVVNSGSLFLGATATMSHDVANGEIWGLVFEEYRNDPGVAWPSGNPAAGPWTLIQLNALEMGVRNDHGSLRCTSLGAEIWLAHNPITVIDILPTGDGFFTDWATINPNVGESPWQDVDEAVPDDAVTYIGADADTAFKFQYCSFTFPAAAPVPAGEVIKSVELIFRVRLGTSVYASIAPLMRDTGLETYLAKPDVIEATGATWFDYRREFFTNPFTGLPWASTAEVVALQHGLAVMEGEMFLSRILVRISTTLDLRATPDPLDLQLTNQATFYMNRSKTDGTVFSPTHFSVGAGGYSPAVPTTVIAVNPADVTLAAEIYRAPISHISYQADTLPWEARYYCRVPQGEGGGGLGEVGLWATIHQSPVPGEAGTMFLYALAHFPCQTKHRDAVDIHDLRIRFP